MRLCFFVVFVFNDTANTELYTSVHILSLHDPLPILAFELPVDVQGRLVTPEELSNVVIKTDTQNGAITRLKDVARVELGSQDYGVRGVFNGQPGVGMAVIQQPGANAHDAEIGRASCRERVW